jgi:hypothetical protein
MWIGGSFESPASLAAPLICELSDPIVRVPMFPRFASRITRIALPVPVRKGRPRQPTFQAPVHRRFVLVNCAGSYPGQTLHLRVHMVHKPERLVQNPVFEHPIPISSGHLLRTLLHPFGLQGSVGSRKSHLQTTRRPRHLSKCKSFSHPRRPAPRLNASQRTKSAASPLSFHL